jgi:hypothetical protein
MTSGKKEIKHKFDGQISELENLLGGILAPVAPRGEFVNQLQQRLESKFDPQPILVISPKIFNLSMIILAGLFSGTILLLLGLKWGKRFMKNY